MWGGRQEAAKGFKSCGPALNLYSVFLWKTNELRCLTLVYSTQEVL